MQTAFVTGSDRGLGVALAKTLVDMGWRVFAGSYLPDWPELAALHSADPDRLTIIPIDIGSDKSVESAAALIGRHTGRLDMIVNNAAVTTESNGPIADTQDFDEFLRVYNVNAVGALRVVRALLPLTETSDLKRICFVSSEAGSIDRCDRKSWFAYCMSKSALNMGVRILFNDLRPRGYTFRLMHPGWLKTYMHGVKNDQAEMEPEEVAPGIVSYFVDPLSAVDEDRLIMRDWLRRDWPW